MENIFNVFKDKWAKILILLLIEIVYKFNLKKEAENFGQKADKNKNPPTVMSGGFVFLAYKSSTMHGCFVDSDMPWPHSHLWFQVLLCEVCLVCHQSNFMGTVNVRPGRITIIERLKAPSGTYSTKNMNELHLIPWQNSHVTTGLHWEQHMSFWGYKTFL